MVQISRDDRKKVYEYLLNEGVIVLKKDFTKNKHEATGVPNLHVWMLLRSLHSRDYVELVFNWRHYYYSINNKGVEYLREKLGITETNVVPETYKKTARTFVSREEREEGGDQRTRRGGRWRGGDRPAGRGYGRGARPPRDQEGEEQPAGEESQAVQEENF